MRSAEQNELLSLGGAVKRGYSSIITNAGKIIAVITLLVAGIVTFTDVGVSDFSSREFTSSLVVMLASSYLMYFSLEDTGEKEGEGSEEYRAARERYLNVSKKITPDSIDGLRAFCLDYSERELEYRRLLYLGERGYSASDLSEYEKVGVASPKDARIFKRVKKMSPIKLSPAVLLSRTQGFVSSELVDPTGKKILGALSSLIPSTVCMIFTVSVILTAKDGMTPSTVMEGILKLSTLPIIGLKGLLDGYAYAKDEKSAWLCTKARLLEAFIGQRE